MKKYLVKVTIDESIEFEGEEPEDARLSMVEYLIDNLSHNKVEMIVKETKDLHYNV